MLIHLIQANLSTRYIGRKIEYDSWTHSTNQDAWTLIDQGASEGTVTVTDKQIKGKGRSGRLWVSFPGKSLTTSLILKPCVKNHLAGWFPLLTGIAIVDALREFGVKAMLKWPNDIMAYGKKLGGILCESKIRGSLLEWTVIGIGLNVNEMQEELPADLNATSIFLELSSFIQIELVLANILNNIELLYDLLKENKDTEMLRNYWTDRCNHVNKSVKFEIDNDMQEGHFIGINNDGAAIIISDGIEKTYCSGDIHINP